MKPIFKITFILFFLPMLVFASNPTEKKHEKSKSIKKEFNVNKDATIYIKNKYGNVDVTTWNENKVSFTIKITVNGNDLDKVKDKLSSINVEFDASSSLVEAITVFEKKKSSWSSWWGNNNNNINYQINYFVKMPVTNNVDFNNKYGNILLDELEGKATINCDYGKISIEKLLNKNNTINLDYCSRSTINYMNSGNINIDYSKLTIEESNQIKASADYSGLKVGSVKDIDFNSDYGSVTINEAENIDGNSDYASMRIGTVKKSLTIDTDYGGLKVENLADGFESVNIDGDYAGIKIGTSAKNFDFTIDLGYASFRYPKENVDMRKEIKKSSKKYYEGSYGNGKSSSTIKIKSSYGSVSIYENE